jgi:hypothetical protein
MSNKQTTTEDTDDRVIYLDDLPYTSGTAKTPSEPDALDGAKPSVNGYDHRRQFKD